MHFWFDLFSGFNDRPAGTGSRFSAIQRSLLVSANCRSLRSIRKRHASDTCGSHLWPYDKSIYLETKKFAVVVVVVVVSSR